jgi:hypothetical protein
VAKSIVTKIFLGSVIAFIAGAVLTLVAALIGFANGAFVMSGPDVTGLEPTPSAWAMVGLFVVAALAVIGGSVGGLVSWIGALLTTAQIDDKTWFVVLLVLGLLSFGLVAMIVYVISGPDGTPEKNARIAATTAAASTAVMGPSK